MGEEKKEEKECRDGVSERKRECVSVCVGVCGVREIRETEMQKMENGESDPKRYQRLKEDYDHCALLLNHSYSAQQRHNNNRQSNAKVAVESTRHTFCLSLTSYLSL
jgi:hypothetical protein